MLLHRVRWPSGLRVVWKMESTDWLVLVYTVSGKASNFLKREESFMNFIVERRIDAFSRTSNLLSPYKRRLHRSIEGENKISTLLVIWVMELNNTKRGRLYKLHRNKKCSLSSFSMLHLHKGEMQLKLRLNRYSLRSLNSTLRRVSSISPYLSWIPYVCFFCGLIVFKISDLNLSIFGDWRVVSCRSFQRSAHYGKKSFCIVE